MHRILVEEHKLIPERQFLRALNFTMLLPGPEAQQLATYIGWLLHRTRGGLAAGLLFVLPGFLSILALSVLYVSFRGASLVEGVFLGIKAAVIVIVIEAVIRIGRRALDGRLHYAIAVSAFMAIFFFQLPYPLIVLAAACIGLASGRFRPHRDIDNSAPAPGHMFADARGAAGRFVRVLFLGLALWFVPLFVLLATLGSSNVFVTEGLFFSQTAVVTFGGAYAVLAYVAQQAVERHGWLQPGEMLDGLGMAETTPGPLIQVVQFVAFMGAYRHAGGLDPIVAGVLASILATWVTFVPCFLWIFLGAPAIEYLQRQQALLDALAGITAAVVGVVLNLSVWFSIHTLFDDVDEVTSGPIHLLTPHIESLDFAALAIAASAAVAMFLARQSMLRVIAGAALAGLLVGLLGTI